MRISNKRSLIAMVTIPCSPRFPISPANASGRAPCRERSVTNLSSAGRDVNGWCAKMPVKSVSS